MARIHGIIGIVLALIAVIFYIVALASTATFESGNSLVQGQIGPFNVCFVSQAFNTKSCAAPDNTCAISIAGTSATFKTLPKCDQFNAYRATLVIAVAFGILGLGVMAYTTFRTGSWTAYLIASGLIAVSALFGLIQMAIAADYKNNQLDSSYDYKYGFALPIVAWILQIPACIVFASTAK